jgi:hypothetical protein
MIPLRLKWQRRDFLKTAALALGWAAGGRSNVFGEDLRFGMIRRLAAPRLLDRLPGTRIKLSGWVQTYLIGVIDQWLKPAPYSNPAILEMFADRDR